MEKLTLYIVNYRYGNDMIYPDICTTEEEADKLAEQFINQAAYDVWGAQNIGEPPEPEELYDWAEEMGYVYSGTFFWDGGDCGYEALVTKHAISL